MRWLVEDFTFHMPFVGAFLTRIGAVRACPENASRLLGREELLAVFPEGAKGPAKLFKDRYKLQRFGRGGYIKLALRTGAPIEGPLSPELGRIGQRIVDTALRSADEGRTTPLLP